MRWPKCFFVLVVCLSMFEYVHSAPIDRPNILWITIEDTSPHFIGCYGDEAVKTPQMDRLANEGVRFTNVFASGAVCSSSRSSIITGVSTESMGTGHHRSAYAIPQSIKGFPYYLRQHGYYTTNNVKTDYNIANVKQFVSEAWDVSSNKAGWWGRAEGQPFFSVFNFMSSHQSRTMTNPWSWYQKNVLDELEPEDRTLEDDFEMPPFYRDSKEMRKHFSRVYNSINLTDTEIGVLLEMLERDGLRDETIIFFYADHGEGVPRGKTNPIALGYRVPFVIWFPEKYKHLNPWGKGVVSDELISFHDLAPTVLSLAGVEIPDYMNGRAFAGESRSDAPKYVYASRNRIDETPDLARSVTDGRFMYTRVFLPQYPVMKYQKYGDVSDIVRIIRRDYDMGVLNDVQIELLQKRPIEYLYDLGDDKWEVKNLVGDANSESTLRVFRKACKKRAIEVKDVLFMPEDMMVHFAEKSTPYEIRMDKELLPIKNVYAMADRVGRGKSVLGAQMRGMKNQNPIIRYWAAVGLFNQQKKDLEVVEGELCDFMSDKSVAVKIEVATILFKNFKNKEAREFLELMALNDSVDVALMALQKMQYMDDPSEFEQIFKQVIKKWEAERSKPAVYKVMCCAEVALHYIDGRPLKY